MTGISLHGSRQAPSLHQLRTRMMYFSKASRRQTGFSLFLSTAPKPMPVPTVRHPKRVPLTGITTTWRLNRGNPRTALVERKHSGHRNPARLPSLTKAITIAITVAAARSRSRPFPFQPPGLSLGGNINLTYMRLHLYQRLYIQRRVRLRLFPLRSTAMMIASRGSGMIWTIGLYPVIWMACTPS